MPWTLNFPPKVDCKHYGAIMAMWNSASLAKDNGMDIAAKAGETNNWAHLGCDLTMKVV